MKIQRRLPFFKRRMKTAALTYSKDKQVHYARKTRTLHSYFKILVDSCTSIAPSSKINRPDLAVIISKQILHDCVQNSSQLK